MGKGRGRVKADSKDHVHARQAMCPCQTCGTGLKFCPTMRREQEIGLEEEAFQAVLLERGEGTE